MKLFLKLVVLVLVLCAGQFIIYKVTHQEIPEISRLNTLLKHPGSIIEFSDSVAHNASPYDIDKRTIPEMINGIQPDLDVQLLWHSSYSLVVFDSYVSYIARSNAHPRAIIVPVNLTGLSPLNEKYPGQLFERLNFVLTTHIPFADVIVHPLSVFHIIDLSTISPQTWLEQKVTNWDKPFGTVQDCYNVPQATSHSFEDIRALYICEYLTPASLQNNNMKALVHLMSTAKKANIPLLIVVSPVDVEEGVRFLGQSFADDVSTNSTFVCNLATQQGVLCMNLASSTPDAHFDNHIYPTPHLDQYGRLQAATSISSALENLFATSTSVVQK